MFALICFQNNGGFCVDTCRRILTTHQYYSTFNGNSSMDIFHACNYSHSPILVKSFVFQKLTLTSAFQIKLSGYYTWCGNSIAWKWGLPRREISLCSFFIKSWKGGNCNTIFFLNLHFVAHSILMHSNFLFCLWILSNFWLNSIDLPKSQRQLSHFSESEAFEVWKKRKYFSRDGSTIAWEGILMRLERDWILMISEIGKIWPQPYSAPLFSFTMNKILTKTKNQGIYFIHVIFLSLNHFQSFEILFFLPATEQMNLSHLLPLQGGMRSYRIC